MKKKVLAGMLILSLGIMACACTKEKPATQTTEKTSESTEKTSETTEQDTGSASENSTEAATATELPREQLTQLQETLNSLYSVAPGSAGSSLRTVAALGQLLDLGESLKGEVDSQTLVTAIKAWKGSYFVADGMQENFGESYGAVKDAAENYFSDPSFYAGEMNDCGYEFKNESYNKENFQFICDCIDEALK